jgi:hypothetical protein
MTTKHTGTRAKPIPVTGQGVPPLTEQVDIAIVPDQIGQPPPTQAAQSDQESAKVTATDPEAPQVQDDAGQANGAPSNSETTAVEQAAGDGANGAATDKAAIEDKALVKAQKKALDKKCKEALKLLGQDRQQSIKAHFGVGAIALEVQWDCGRYAMTSQVNAPTPLERVTHVVTDLAKVRPKDIRFAGDYFCHRDRTALSGTTIYRNARCAVTRSQALIDSPELGRRLEYRSHMPRPPPIGGACSKWETPSPTGASLSQVGNAPPKWGTPLPSGERPPQFAREGFAGKRAQVNGCPYQPCPRPARPSGAQSRRG